MILIIVIKFCGIYFSGWDDGRGYMKMTSLELAKYLENQGIYNSEVLKAVAKIPRELFVEPQYRDSAYADHPLPIPCGQTISQPYLVAFMTQVLMENNVLTKVLEIERIGISSGDFVSASF